MIEIRIDNRQLKEIQRQLAEVPGAMPRVMSRALNRTATEARTQTSRRLSKDIGLRVKDVRDRIVIERASQANWRSAIRFRAGALPIARFPHEQTAEGVTWRPSRAKTRLIPHAFIARMPVSGHRGVFLRARYAKGRYIAMKGRKKEAIYEQKVRFEEVFADSQQQMDRIYLESMQRLQKNIHDQVELILRRRAG